MIVLNKFIRLLDLNDDIIDNINTKFISDVNPIAVDVFGGFFADHNDVVFYFTPDSLNFESLNITRSTWNDWCKTEQANDFYVSWVWDDFGNFIESLRPEQGISFYPPLFTKEFDIHTASKQKVPINELVLLNLDTKTQLDR